MFSGKKYQLLFPALAFLILYLLFPTQNSGIDGYYYAASVKHAGELFHPHHLLYNITHYLVISLFQLAGAGADVLLLMKVLNAFTAFAILLLAGKLMQDLSAGLHETVAVVVLTGSSYSIMRFATENETYLLPLFFSLLGSVFLLHFIRTRFTGYALLCGLSASIAVLYHQIHLFWWMGLFAGICFRERSFRACLFYLSTGMLVPAVYLLVYYLSPAIREEGSLVYFVLRAFYTGDAGTGIGRMHFLLSFVNLVRSFIQVHGNIPVFIRSDSWFILPAVLFFLCLAAGLISRKKASLQRKEVHTGFLWAHVLTGIMQFGFAFFSAGNAEFMVMLPLLTWLIVVSCFRISPASLLWWGAGILIWNTGYGLVPSHIYRYDHATELARRIHEEPGNLYILKEDQKVLAVHYYLYGKEDIPNLSRSPSDLERKKIPEESLREKIREYRDAGGKVYTDCTGRPDMLDRAFLLDRGNDRAFFSAFVTLPADTLESIYGKTLLVEVVPRD